jgi:hypothetical protein
LREVVLPPIQNVAESASRSPFSSFTKLLLGWYPLLNSFIPLYRSLMFLFLLFVAISSILSFRYSLFLFLPYTPDIQQGFLLNVDDRKEKCQALDMPPSYRRSSISLVNWSLKDAT